MDEIPDTSRELDELESRLDGVLTDLAELERQIELVLAAHSSLLTLKLPVFDQSTDRAADVTDTQRRAA